MALDLPQLREICAQWPTQPVPDEVAENGILERLRQVLQAMQKGSEAPADLIPLFRQVLLRRGMTTLQSLRVPATSDWPTPDTWRRAQCRVDAATDGLNVTPLFPRLEFLGQQADLFDDAFRELPSRPTSGVPGDPPLHRAFQNPRQNYSGDGQREAVRALLHLPPGETLIANLPTGTGKSLLAQLPALLDPDGPLVLVIVPTVALALDQARHMQALLARRRPGAVCPPLAYHAGLAPEERAQVRQALSSGTQPILFVSPESATGALRRGLEDAASLGRLSHVVIDEAHLVTGWGDGFRPEFQLLPGMIYRLRRRAAPQALRVVLASATLSAETLADLRRLFGSPNTTHLVAAVHLRAEPRYALSPCPDPATQIRWVMTAIHAAPRPFILYVTRPVEATMWLARLRMAGFRRVAAFTGETSPAQRDDLLSAWTTNALDGMVATSAFGLGVDKADVRAVLHATLPESLDRFYQEVGRGGRDGRACASLLVHTPEDRRQAEAMAEETQLTTGNAFKRWRRLLAHATPGEEADEYWVDLNTLPPHLQVRSNWNQFWNVRTLTLMARAGLISLVGLRHRSAPNAAENRPPETHVAVRLLDAGHHRDARFAERLAAARAEIRHADIRGLETMRLVADRQVEVAQALTTTYQIVRDDWVPVAAVCAGCTLDWDTRPRDLSYRVPYPGHLPRFAARDLSRFRALNLPMAAPNLLVVTVTTTAALPTTAEILARYLVSWLRPHTWVLDAGPATELRPALARLLGALPGADGFIDVLDGMSTPSGGGWDEVRVLVLDRERTGMFPRDLWLSRSALDVVVVPINLGDPDHPLRAFTDTTPHLSAIDLLHKLSR